MKAIEWSRVFGIAISMLITSAGGYAMYFPPTETGVIMGVTFVLIGTTMLQYFWCK